MGTTTASRARSFTIGVLSERTGVNIETIRYYERIKLLPPPSRTAGNQRIYEGEHQKRLTFIRRARELGFTIEDIRSMLTLVDRHTITCGEVQGIGERQLANVRAKMADLKRLERVLTTMTASCSGGAAPECPIVDALFESPDLLDQGPSDFLPPVPPVTSGVGRDPMQKGVVELRPGVLRPDWSAATTPAAQKALGARADARSTLMEKWLQPLTPDEDRVWRAVLELYADLGRPPRTAETSVRTGLPEAQIRDLLHQLQERDLLALGPDGEAIRHVYPFTEGKTGHQVVLGRHVFNALCAVDALGTGDMYRSDVEIRSPCRSCGHEIRIKTANKGQTLAEVSPAGAVVWYELAYTDSAASSCCRTIAFFCSDEHLERWLEGRSSQRTGMRLSISEAFEVGRAIFAPVLRVAPACSSQGSAAREDDNPLRPRPLVSDLDVGR